MKPSGISGGLKGRDSSGIVVSNSSEVGIALTAKERVERENGVLVRGNVSLWVVGRREKQEEEEEERKEREERELSAEEGEAAIEEMKMKMMMFQRERNMNEMN